MNLYEFSQVNNNEMGIYIEKQKDPELFKDIYNEAHRLIRISDEIIVSIEMATKEKQSVAEKQQSKEDKQQVKVKGYCIRTGVEIPFNKERPLSYQAYQSWSKFSNEEYPEKYCHYSGEPSNGETTVQRPILRKNWQKARSAMK